MPLTRRRFIATGALAAASSRGAAPNPPPPAAATEAAGPIETATLRAAERLANLEFTAEQRQPLVKGVTARATGYAELRANPIPNHVFPAVTFDPRLAGVQVPRGGAAPLPAPSMLPEVVRPSTDDELAFLSVTQLASLLRSRRVTSRKLTELAIARLKRFDRALSAVVNLTEERAMRQADAADAELQAGRWRGPLHGVPWGAKDLFSVQGYPTTWGAAQFKHRHLEGDAEVVRRLDAAGAVLVAKLSLGALASGDNWFGGQTKCPWNLATGSSGSSAGSCAAVAAGLVPFALGSETLGSIVSPSARNGVTGFRPSHGRVSRSGAMALAWSMDKIGPIARSAEDCALIFAAIHGADPADPTAVDVPFSWSPPADLRGWRIGILEGSTDNASSSAVDCLRRIGAELVPIALPKAPVQAMRLILTVEAAAAFDEFTRSGEIDRVIPPRPSNWANTMREARYVTAVEYIQANRLRTRLIGDLERTLADAGVAAWVSAPSGPHLTLTNLTGHPSVCVPVGFEPVAGAPADSPRRTVVAATFHAPLYRDELALAAAHALQQASDWHRRRPPIV